MTVLGRDDVGLDKFALDERYFPADTNLGSSPEIILK
jgi:hypothetical protein